VVDVWGVGWWVSGLVTLVGWWVLGGWVAGWRGGAVVEWCGGGVGWWCVVRAVVEFGSDVFDVMPLCRGA